MNYYYYDEDSIKYINELYLYINKIIAEHKTNDMRLQSILEELSLTENLMNIIPEGAAEDIDAAEDDAEDIDSADDAKNDSYIAKYNLLFSEVQTLKKRQQNIISEVNKSKEEYITVLKSIIKDINTKSTVSNKQNLINFYTIKKEDLPEYKYVFSDIIKHL